MEPCPPKMAEAAKRPIIAGIGELLWDMLPTGQQLGGAPANFAYQAGALGAQARIISRVGNDDLGREALHRLKQLGLSTDGIEVDPVLPTGTVTVQLAEDGQPQFTIHENVAWDALAGSPAGRQSVQSADALCFGSLAQRSELSRSTIRSLVTAAPPSALRILDVNLRQHYYSRSVIEDSLRLANVFKVNDTELIRLAEMLQLTGDERAQIVQLADRYALRCVACTRGGRGSLLFAEGRWSDQPGIPTKIVDTVGAGDAFTAAMALGLLAGWPLDEVNHRATELASFVCSQAGATPRLPDRLSASFLRAPGRIESRSTDASSRIDGPAATKSETVVRSEDSIP
jgi:fructokinase